MDIGGERWPGEGCAPIPFHGAVEGVHSIDKKQVKGAEISLTLEMGVVQTQSFFDTF